MSLLGHMSVSFISLIPESYDSNLLYIQLSISETDAPLLNPYVRV
jgi:hypothetical protein